MRQKLEVLANICTVVATLAITVLFVNRLVSGTGTAQPQAIKAGTKLPTIASVDYRDRPTLMLYLSSTCSFCTRSMDFYRKLTAHANAIPQAPRIVVVGSETHETLTDYLNDHGVVVDSVITLDPGVHAKFADIGMSATPTLTLVDRSGKVVQSWLGLLPQANQDEVLSLVSRYSGENVS
jgi:hypothetical protein